MSMSGYKDHGVIQPICPPCFRKIVKAEWMDVDHRVKKAYLAATHKMRNQSTLGDGGGPSKG